ncbi:MAG: membrane protein insertase YidC [Marinifilaceae bacterium]
MDKNTLTGLVLIFLILIGFSYFTRPSQEELSAIRAKQDSVAKVEAARMEQAKELSAEDFAAAEEGTIESSTLFKQDSLTDRVITLQNNLIKVDLSTKGGRIVSVNLKEYQTADSMPLNLWLPKKSTFGLSFFAQRKEYFTQRMLFVPSTTQSVLDAATGAQKLTMKLMVNENSYIAYNYTLQPNSYAVDFDIEVRNMENYLDMNTSVLNLTWGVDMPQLEKSKDFENRYTGVYYKFYNDNVDNMSMTSNEEESLKTSVEWIAFKQQFFSSVLISKQPISGVIVNSAKNDNPGYLKTVSAQMPLQYTGQSFEKYDMEFFFGPNAYSILKEYGGDIQLTELINLGWKWISWFNKYFVIPIFDFLATRTTLNFGIIILILTLIVKIILFPLTFKSYKSQARMRVLKPQIDEINQKYPSDRALERQQATMELYKKAGVNPMGGCLPMLIQMPILIALFYFFPSAIELRQESFLWAKDLASYDSIATLPFTIPFYGNHVSLFCLLMTIVNIVYMKMNSKNQPQNDQMKGMQSMMYIMPVMFLFIFNNYSAALSYYYFIATLITIVQTWLIQRSVDDQKILQEIELAKTRPVKKSGWQKRLEDAQRMQQQRLNDQKKKKK